MNTETSYSYVTLRYIHDIATREFVNVGVVLFSNDQACVGARVLSSLDRVIAMFPDVKADHLRTMLSHIQAQVGILNSKLGSTSTPSKRRIQELVATVLPNDDSSLQWGDVGGGVSSDLKRTLNALFERLVSRYLKRSGNDQPVPTHPAGVVMLQSTGKLHVLQIAALRTAVAPVHRIELTLPLHKTRRQALKAGGYFTLPDAEY